MKSALFQSVRLILTLNLLGTVAGLAAETATISAGTVNVRGRAGFIGEVVTRLNQGDAVTVLETVVLKSPKAGEPAEWLRIALPANTPVWVHASYVDAATQTVNTAKLKVRGGPGLNYSVLGQIAQGTAVKEISRKGDWMEIEPTPDLHAFIAASMVTRGTPAELATVPAAPGDPATSTAAPVVTSTEPAPTTTEAPAATSPEATPPVVDTSAPAPVTSTPPSSTTAITPPAGSTAIVAEPAPAIASAPETANRDLTTDERARQVLEQRTRDSQRWEITEEPDSRLLKELPANRRVVTREGKIRHSISIQAPGDYILTHIESGLRLNYLYTSSTNLPLKDLVGVKVRIQGEEGIDSRWPGTPVLLIKALEVLP